VGQLKEILLRTGALLSRGFPLLSASTFGQFVREFSGRELRNYVGGASPRKHVAEGVYTSTEYPQDIDLSLHNAMSYTYCPPQHLYVTCLVAPDKGGETPLANSRQVLKQISAPIVREFSEKKIRYYRRLSSSTKDGYSWQEAFESDDVRAIAEYCRAGNVEFEWKPDLELVLMETRPALATHPLSREEVWFNQADSFYSRGNQETRLAVTFGDGTPIREAALNQIRYAMASETVFVKWEMGDVLILDNLLTAHGRRPFRGNRSVLLAMT
jgi:alpha-ketoglutarate-dependent taurine dioxygenase